MTARGQLERIGMIPTNRAHWPVTRAIDCECAGKTDTLAPCVGTSAEVGPRGEMSVEWAARVKSSIGPAGKEIGPVRV
jgi:hypothetical protein